MRQYVDSCRTFAILLQDSGLVPKPREDWNTFEPKENDIAHVDENNKDYIYKNGQWEEMKDE